MPSVTALVLAGRRTGEATPPGSGAAHPALLDVAGAPMLVRVVHALHQSPSVARVVVSSDDPDALVEVPELRELEFEPSLHSPSQSVLDFVSKQPAGAAVLVVTADHALLTPAMVEYFVDASLRDGANLVVGVVEAALVRDRFPRARRTFLPFRGGALCGANLFVFKTAQAAHAAGFWRHVERHRKHPWRLAAAFGPTALARFATRRLSLEAALALASRVMQVEIGAVRIPLAEAAIDVDGPEDLAIVRALLCERNATTRDLE